SFFVFLNRVGRQHFFSSSANTESFFGFGSCCACLFHPHSLVAPDIAPQNGNGKGSTFSCRLLCDNWMSEMTAAAMTISEASKFPFSYTFSQLEERPILSGPLATHGSLRTGSWAYPPIFRTDLTLDHVTRNYLHITD
ncbi:hypothetical protein CCMA1212_008455, partial [Trichoderma ghanense]